MIFQFSHIFIVNRWKNRAICLISYLRFLEYQKQIPIGQAVQFIIGYTLKIKTREDKPIIRI